MKTVYTVILGNYDDLKEPTVVTPGWRYVCFTDQPLTSQVWEIVPIPPGGRRAARRIKILFHEYVSTQYSLWLDASFHIRVDLDLFWNRVFHSPFTAPKHPARSCVYQEGRSCIANNRGEPDLVQAQMDLYKLQGVPTFSNLITSGVLMRENTPECIKLCNEWWKEMEQHSTRDQMAFVKVSQGFPLHIYHWDYSRSAELKYTKHLHLRK